MFLNSGCVREEIPRDTRSYYLTGGWFRHNSSVTEAFEEWAERYGAERAASLRKTMFNGYQRVTLIDTQAYPLDDYLALSREYAEDLDLQHTIVPGSVQLLKRLFTKELDSEIVVVAPGEAIGYGHLFGEAERPTEGR